MEKETRFNPQEHVAVPAESEDILHPESFVSLRAVVDQEKARILAQEVQKDLEPLFDDMATGEVMLAEEKDPESRQILQEEMNHIKSAITEKINEQHSMKELQPFALADIIAMSSVYHELVSGQGYYNTNIDTGLNTQRNMRRFSEEEKKMLERYNTMAREKIISILKEANQHQQRILQFLVEQNFGIPALPEEKTDENINAMFGDIFSVIVEKRVLSNHHKKDSDEVILQRCQKEFKDRWDKFQEGHKQIITPAEWFENNPQMRQTLKLWRAFDMNVVLGSFDGILQGITKLSGERGLGQVQFTPTTLALNYNAENIKDRLGGKESEALLPSSIPEQTTINNLPFQLMAGGNLESALKASREFGELIDTDPNKAFALFAPDKQSQIQMAVEKLSLLYVIQGDAKNEIHSPSYSFLGKVA